MRTRRTRGSVAAAGMAAFALTALALALGLGTGARPALAQGFTVQSNIHYGPDPAQVGDVYLPAGSGPFPALVLIHSGKFQFGDKRLMAPASQYAAEHGYVAFDINYRFAPQFQFPDQLNDVEGAVEFIRSHAAQYHVDPVRVGALGGSSGANLAGMLATEGSGPPTGFRVVAAALWSCPCDLTPFQGPDNKYLGQGAAPSLIQQASPLYQVDPTDAPLFVANGTNEEIPPSQYQAMQAAYQKAGIAFQLQISPQSLHAEQLGATMYPQTFAFLDRYVKGYQPGTEPSTSPPPTTTPPPTGTVRPRRTRHRRTPPPASGTNVGLIVAVIIGAAVLGAGLVTWLLRRGRPPAGPGPPAVR